jgi:hypothetical protein
MTLPPMARLAGRQEVRALDAAGGGEGPAGPAAALVLYWGHGALGPPVHRRA